MNALPFISQYASHVHAHQYATGCLDPADDPEWRRSGWSTSSDYAFWAGRSCGVACLQMILAHRNTFPSTAELVSDLLEAGAYLVKNDGSVIGLVYQPFVEYVIERWGLMASTFSHLPVQQLVKTVALPNRFVIASVRPSIRELTSTAPAPACSDRRGGHLVLVLNGTMDALQIHNPSGIFSESQAAVTLPLELFNTVYAERGITVEIADD